MINVGDILSTVGVFSTMGGYHEYRGGLSWVPWGMFSTVGGYHEYHGGCSVPWGISSFEIWVPWGDIMMHVGGYHEYRGVFSTVGYSNNNWLFPPRYWTPSMVLMISPTCIMIPPTVLNIPHGTQDNPHGTHDIPPQYWTPPRYSRYPPTVLNTPHGTQDIPPRYWTPPTVLHTHYTGWLDRVIIEHVQKILNYRPFVPPLSFIVLRVQSRLHLLENEWLPQNNTDLVVIAIQNNFE